MASTRFPGKMLADRTGTPLIVHCALNARRASTLDHVCIASDSDEIAAAAQRYGVEHFMTRGDHPNGTSRIAEVAPLLKADIIVNVQGDEPELPPEVIDAAVQALQNDPDAIVATAASPLVDQTLLGDPTVVKVVLDSNRRAMYFSRSAIPNDRDGDGPAHALRHIGLYVYRPAALVDYVALGEGQLERTEQLEQLRLLEHGRPIAVALVAQSHGGIDTPEQYEDWVARTTDSC